MKTPETDAGPPLRAISTPACRCNSSARPWTPARAISAVASITVRSASRSAIGRALRVAVTATCASLSARASAPSSAAAALPAIDSDSVNRMAGDDRLLAIDPAARSRECRSGQASSRRSGFSREGGVAQTAFAPEGTEVGAYRAASLGPLPG